MRNCISTLAILLVAACAMAQPCAISASVDESGYSTVFNRTPGVIFDIYVVMHVESTVAGVAFTIAFPPWILPSIVSYGPSGLGINVNGAGGMNVGLGECALGFNSLPIVVAHYSVFPLDGPDAFVVIGPNLDEDPNYPVYASCADQLLPCETVIDLWLMVSTSTNDMSIGALKALYGN